MGSQVPSRPCEPACAHYHHLNLTTKMPSGLGCYQKRKGFVTIGCSDVASRHICMASILACIYSHRRGEAPCFKCSRNMSQSTEGLGQLKKTHCAPVSRRIEVCLEGKHRPLIGDVGVLRAAGSSSGQVLSRQMQWKQKPCFSMRLLKIFCHRLSQYSHAGLPESLHDMLSILQGMYTNTHVCTCCHCE